MWKVYARLGYEILKVIRIGCSHYHYHQSLLCHRMHKVFVWFLYSESESAPLCQLFRGSCKALHIFCGSTGPMSHCTSPFIPTPLLPTSYRHGLYRVVFWDTLLSVVLLVGIAFGQGMILSNCKVQQGTKKWVGTRNYRCEVVKRGVHSILPHPPSTLLFKTMFPCRLFGMCLRLLLSFSA